MNKIIDIKPDLAGAILFRNEEEFIQQAMEHVYPHVDKLVMLNDCSNDKSYEIALEFAKKNKNVFLYNLPNFLHEIYGFGDKKNFLISLCNSEWVYIYDCDELVSEGFWRDVRKLIIQKEVECYALPRKNYIDNKFQEDAFPDYQTRLGRSYLRYVLPVHEELVGYEDKRKVKLDPEGDSYIIHKKSSSRQAEQDQRYKKVALKFQKQLKPFAIKEN